MTEELKQKFEKRFEKWLRKYLLCIDCKRKCTCIQLNAYCEEQVKQAYLAGLHEGQPKWHKVSEKLPPIEDKYNGRSKVVLVFCEGEHVELAQWVEKENAWARGICEVPYKVLMWTDFEIPQFKE